ncbi:DUF177 domain-containing protein, partial [bacterium]|nr:DUF177 domain-containing protein [bacterium]
MSATEDGPKPEFSRCIPVERLRRGALSERIEANEGERKALAERFELESVGALTAEVLLEPMKSGMVRVSGRLDAKVVQTCVVSLESVPASVGETFAALFAPPEMIGEEDHDVIDVESLIEDVEDLPEPFVENRIDIGELVAQHLSLALEPYPRAVGVDFTEVREHEIPDGGFDALND